MRDGTAEPEAAKADGAVAKPALDEASTDDLVAFLLAERDPARRWSVLSSAMSAAPSPADWAVALAGRLKEEADRHWWIDARVSQHLGSVITCLGDLAGDTGTLKNFSKTS